MTDQELDPAIVKLVEYGKAKKVLNWDEINDLLPPEILNSDKMDTVLMVLEQNKIQVIEEDLVLEDEDDEEAREQAEEAAANADPDKPEKDDDLGRKRLVNNDKPDHHHRHRSAHPSGCSTADRLLDARQSDEGVWGSRSSE